MFHWENRSLKLNQQDFEFSYSGYSQHCGTRFYSNILTIRENKPIFMPAECIAQLYASDENDEQ